MKVECPNCQSTFNLPDDKVGPDGARVRCGVCKHVFTAELPPSNDFPGFGDSGASPVWPVSGEEEFQPVIDEKRADPYDSLSVSSKDFASIDFGSAPVTSGSSRKKTIMLLAILIALFVVCVGGSAAYLFDFWPFAKKTVSTSVMEEALPPGTQPGAAQTPPQAAAQNFLESIQFSHYEHNPVDNEKIGNMLVISGKLVNNSPGTLGQIKIQADLLGADEKVMDSQVITAGPTLSLVDLKVLPLADLQARLNSIQDIMLHNGRVRPGDEVPFMVVFSKIPEGTKNFSLKIADYLEVATVPASDQPAAK